MTETCGAKVNFVLRWDRQNVAYCWWREEGHLEDVRRIKRTIRRTYNEVLEESISAFEIDIRAAGEVASLLQKHGVGTVYLANIDDHFL